MSVRVNSMKDITVFDTRRSSREFNNLASATYFAMMQEGSSVDIWNNGECKNYTVKNGKLTYNIYS